MNFQSRMALEKYRAAFQDLHPNQNARWGNAPHKPILLLAVLDEIEQGQISSNLIPLTVSLMEAFHYRWISLVPEQTWSEQIALPFTYLSTQGFWRLTKDGKVVDKSAVGSPSITKLQTIIDGGCFVPDLWGLFQEKEAVNILRETLLQTYFSSHKWSLQPTRSIDYMAQRLAIEAESAFRVRKIQEPKDDVVYYLRHAKFPQVIKSFYDYRCAVCALKAGSQGGTIVDAAHIMPFHLFHNDHPRNGIAFCKNHHWGFDAGWFSVSDDYKVIVSPHFQQEQEDYIAHGASLLLPSRPTHNPALEALAWHRTKHGFS